MNRIPTWFVALLAVALVLGLSGVVMADECAGKVKSVEAGKIVVTDKDGKDHTITIPDKVEVSGKATKLTEVKKDANVVVTCKKEGDKIIASKIEVK